MKLWPAMLGILLCLAAPTARAAAVSDRHVSAPAVRAQAIALVRRQLAAFRADDWPQAYGLAAEVFRARMSLRQFVTLITRNYPVVWKNTRADFGLPQDNGVRAVVPVRVFAADGRSEAYEYLLVREPAGWAIIGLVRPVAGAGDT